MRFLRSLLGLVSLTIAVVAAMPQEPQRAARAASSPPPPSISVKDAAGKCQQGDISCCNSVSAGSEKNGDSFLSDLLGKDNILSGTGCSRLDLNLLAIMGSDTCSGNDVLCCDPQSGDQKGLVNVGLGNTLNCVPIHVL
ncbi:MAG: hypothetical protein M1840_002638 [Geoglossum simile]|nr:MAG: hypothetical protein M1840_002638 [Geoglossum simile]